MAEGPIPAPGNWLCFAHEGIMYARTEDGTWWHLDTETNRFVPAEPSVEMREGIAQGTLDDALKKIRDLGLEIFSSVPPDKPIVRSADVAFHPFD